MKLNTCNRCGGFTGFAAGEIPHPGWFCNCPVNTREEIFKDLAEQLPETPDKSVMDFGYWLKELLVEKTGEAVDTGAGFNAFDLWVKHNGQEFFVTVKQTKHSMN